ncbi:YajQ family cyclic di-GMP-binding protein [Oceanicoccus sagamiensis]|uniref:Nucleotide-binding protein BST96_12090 n=1 Tax=Oceanicoccus sagamiensis TaxID=716816 RepID=A0A1X9NCM6_9GAMM|nr:YajQ family cyclic di-GMP-binding protein [Oceanicoccus sagamiensis]ARN74794.1 YajQ family cyclic di-GMP-binding protein [Oceanicoccus sagamiensis]
MPSFDIVSEVDAHEFTNAVDQAGRIIQTRFDFKGVDAKFERNELTVTIFAEADFQITQMEDMLRTALIKCKIDPLAMTMGEIETAGKQVKQLVTMQNGLESDLARKIVKLIKEKKMKVQSQIQGDQVRVTGKKRDDLQQVMAFLREEELGQPLQFNNFRD